MTTNTTKHSSRSLNPGGNGSTARGKGLMNSPQQAFRNRNQPAGTARKTLLAQQTGRIPMTQQSRAASFFVTLLCSATEAHILHLKSHSYSEHKALEDLYKGLPKLTDILVEGYQGRHGHVERYPGQSVDIRTDALQFVRHLGDYVSGNRSHLGSDSEIQNVVDGIMELINSTAYRIQFLK